MRKRLSVIIPGYNTSKAWWMRCVDSALKAIGPADEIIVVDDGSEEKWPVFGDWWSDGRVKVVRKENGGLSSARNAGLNIAQGEYVAFIDSDDEVLPEAFERCLEKIQATGADICVYGVRTIWTEERLCKQDCPAERDYGPLTACDVAKLTEMRIFNYAWNKVYRREFLQANNLRFDSDGMPCEDAIFNLECVMARGKWCSVNQVGYVYYRTGGTLLSRYKKSNGRGLKLCSDTWQRWRLSDPGAAVAFPNGIYAELSERQICWLEWTNLWLPGSPLGFFGRYGWIRKRRETDAPGIWGRLLKISPLLLTAAYGVRTFLRRNLYLGFMRRRAILRRYPHAVCWARGLNNERNLVFPIVSPCACYSKNANAYQKCCVVTRNLGGVLAIPSGRELWLHKEFWNQTRSVNVPLKPGCGFFGQIGVALSLFWMPLRLRQKATGFVFSVSNEFALFGIIAASLLLHIKYALFCWDPPGVSILNRSDAFSRLRCRILDLFFSVAANRSECVILNLQRGFLEGRFPKKICSKFIPFPNGTQFARNRAVTEGIEHVPFRIGINGAFTEDKGCREAAELFVSCWRKDARLSLVWTGVGGDAEIVRRIFRDAGIPDSSWEVFQDCGHENALRHLRTASVALNPYRNVPSLRWNYVLKIPEFLSLGIPVVTLDAPGVREYASEGVILVQNLENAAAEITALFADEEHLGKVQEACVAKARCYDWDRLNGEIAHVLRQVFKEEPK